MSDLDRKYIEALEAENDALRAQIDRLEESLGVKIEAPLCLGLTGKQVLIFGVLYKREIVTKATAMAVMYRDMAQDEAGEKIVDVQICKMRPKLKPFGIEIETVWGQGFVMPVASKARVRELLNSKDKTAA